VKQFRQYASFNILRLRLENAYSRPKKIWIFGDFNRNMENSIKATPKGTSLRKKHVI